MTTNTVEVVRTPTGNFTAKGEAGAPEFDPVAALGPEVARPFQIAVLQEVIGLRLREIGFAASVSDQSVRNWKKKDSPDRPAGYDDLRAVAERILSAGTIDPMLIGAWFRSRNRGLGYTRPLEAIRAGEFPKVMDVAESFIALSPPVAAPPPQKREKRKNDYIERHDLGKELAELSEESP